MKKYAGILYGLSLATIFTSCLKDKNIEDRKYGPQGYEDVRLAEFSSAEFVAGVNFSNNDTTIHLATVHLNSATPAASDVKVKLRRNDAAVTDAGYDLLPANQYTLSSLEVTIPKGSRNGYVDLKVNPATLLNGHYAFAFVIESADNNVNVSANFNNIFSELIVLNQYDGIYRATGIVRDHPSLSGVFEREIVLQTTSLTSVEFAQPYHSGAFSVYIDADVNPNNSVTLTGSPTPLIPAGAQNRYDPATRTFYLEFKWAGSPLSRHAVDTFVYVRPRF